MIVAKLFEPAIFIAVAGVIMVVFVGWSFLSAKWRSEALAKVAADLGLAFSAEGSGLLSELSHLPLFSRGRARRIRNLIYGDTEEAELAIFDYQYTVGSGKNSHTYRQSVALMRSRHLQLPQFELKPQGFFHAIGKLFGYQDIDFDHHPRFSKIFILRGQDVSRIRAAFPSSVLSFLEERPTTNLEACGHELIYYRQGKRVKPEQIKGLMAEGFTMLQQFTAEREQTE